MTEDAESPDAVEKIVEKKRQQWEQLSRRERLRRRGAYRNRHRLYRKWREALDEYDGPGRAVLVDDYRPSGWVAPYDVGEIAGVIVWDARGTAHHLRLFRDERAAFIGSPDDPEAPIAIDPMTQPFPRDKVYLSQGVPEAVTQVIDALEVSPIWRRACPDGEHEYVTEELHHRGTVQSCEKCEFGIGTLSWLGHGVPTGNAAPAIHPEGDR